MTLHFPHYWFGNETVGGPEPPKHPTPATPSDTPADSLLLHLHEANNKLLLAEVEHWKARSKINEDSLLASNKRCIREMNFHIYAFVWGLVLGLLIALSLGLLKP